MGFPVRKSLQHAAPFCIDASDAFYFVTVCAEGHHPWICHSVGADHRAARVPETARQPHTFDEIARVILDEARFFHQHGKWFLTIMTVMPDHLHAIVHGPPGGRPLPLVIGDFKRYLSYAYGLAFQSDFFDTRIRDDAHYAEKWEYIVRNPVRRGFAATPRDWPHVIAFDRATGEERPHR